MLHKIVGIMSHTIETRLAGACFRVSHCQRIYQVIDKFIIISAGLSKGIVDTFIGNQTLFNEEFLFY